jgi:predicted ester cyclase
MTGDGLGGFYRGYIDCLNRRDWAVLGRFVDEDVVHNGRQLGLSGYRAMLEGDFRAIPDLHFNIGLLVVEPPHVASRLEFDCTPTGELFGLPVNGRRVRFAENVFYEIRDGRISEVWSIIDKAAIAAQLQPSGA